MVKNKITIVLTELEAEELEFAVQMTRTMYVEDWQGSEDTTRIKAYNRILKKLKPGGNNEK